MDSNLGIAQIYFEWLVSPNTKNCNNLTYFEITKQYTFCLMNLNVPPTPNMFLANIKIGLEVDIVLKKDQRTGKRTRGRVRWIFTSAPFHSRGIKVMLENRQVGRVQEIFP